MTHMKRTTLKFINLFTLFLFGSIAAIAQPGVGGTVAEGIVAVVGDNIILKSEVEGSFEALQAQYRQNGLTLEICDVVEDQLMEKLLLHHAEVDSVMVDDNEVESNVNRRLEALLGQFGGDIKKLETYYGKSMAEIREEMKPLMRNQLTAQRMQYSITQNVEVTPTEVQEYFETIPKDSIPLINSEVEMAQIVVYPAIDEEEEQYVIEKLTDFKQRILEGRSFATMAILYSEDPGSQKNGGMYEGIKRGQFVKEFEAVAFNLQPGEVSDPFRTVYGYHIVQLIAKRGEELDLRHILIKPKISDVNLNEAKNAMDSIRLKIARGDVSFEDAVELYSEDDGTRYNRGMLMNPQTGDTKWDVSSLDRGVFYAIQGVNVGGLSEPVLWRDDEQKEAFRIIRVVSKTEPHQANMQQDYGRLQAMALQHKQGEEMDRWLREKINHTYIRINNEYYNCTFSRNWSNDGTSNTGE